MLNLFSTFFNLALCNKRINSPDRIKLCMWVKFNEIIFLSQKVKLLGPVVGAFPRSGGSGGGRNEAVMDKRPVVVTHFLPNTSAPELLHYGAAGRHARLAALAPAVVFF